MMRDTGFKLASGLQSGFKGRKATVYLDDLGKCAQHIFSWEGAFTRLRAPRALYFASHWS